MFHLVVVGEAVFFRELDDAEEAEKRIHFFELRSCGFSYVFGMVSLLDTSGMEWNYVRIEYQKAEHQKKTSYLTMLLSLWQAMTMAMLSARFCTLEPTSME